MADLLLDPMRCDQFGTQLRCRMLMLHVLTFGLQGRRLLRLKGSSMHPALFRMLGRC